MSHLDAEELACLHHILRYELWLKLFEQRNTDSENRFPALSDKHVKNRRQQMVRKETRKQSHEPF